MLRVLFTLAAMMISAMVVAAPTQSQLDAALHEVNSEEIVFDASWQDIATPSLVARVFDKGTRRDGYAGYLCMILSEHGINGGVVRVIDVVSKDRKELGQAKCK